MIERVFCSFSAKVDMGKKVLIGEKGGRKRGKKERVGNKRFFMHTMHGTSLLHEIFPLQSTR